MLGESISRNAILLGLFAALSTAIIAGTFLSTRPAIQDNIRKAEEKALLEIIPADTHDNAMLDDAIPVDDSRLLGLRAAKKLYVAKRQGKPIGMIIPATARDGYTGDIDLIVGVWLDGTIAGVRVLSHRETPGLGDAIDRRKSRWIDHFVGKSLNSPTIKRWAVKKDGGEFDQFTGATITPRAVITAVKNTLQYFEQHRDRIAEPNTANPSAMSQENSGHD